MSMAVSKDHTAVGIIQGNEKFLRIKTLLNHAGYELYCKLFLDTNYGGFSRQPDLIYKELLEHRSTVESLKTKGDITEGDFICIFPPSEETYLRECSLSLLHKLCQVCVKNFPAQKTQPNDPNKNKAKESVSEEKQVDNALESITYIKQLENLQKIIYDEKLHKLVNRSNEEFESKWNEINDLLVSLGYDINKVSDIKTTDDLDSCKSCHAAFLRSETELLLQECNNLLKVSDVNTLTLNRLVNNLKEAFALEGKKDEDIFPLKEMNDLKESIDISKNMLNISHESLQVLFPDLKYWKDKNIEGDIIIIDEMLNKLCVQVDKQSRSVSDYFNTVSFDIVKIKEKVNCPDESNVRYHLKAPEPDVKDKKISLGFVSIGF